MSVVERFLDKKLPEAARIAAARELGNRIAKERPLGAAWNAVCTVAHDDHDVVAVRISALTAMSRAPGAAVNQLIRSFHDPERLLRKEAVRLLRSIGFIGNEGSLRAELEAAKAGDTVPLATLAFSSGYDPRVVAAYREAATNPDPRVRALALAGLAMLGEMTDQVSGLRDVSPAVRASTAESLGAYGTLEEAEIAALRSALNDPENGVARAAKTALKRLGILPSAKSRSTELKSTHADAGDQWRMLLSSLSHFVLKDSWYAATLDDGVVESGWLGFPGATDAELAELSGRLGTRLPSSYEAFLRVTNGFRRISPFIERVWSTREVRPFSADNSDWIQIYRNSPLPPLSDAEHRRYGSEQDCAVFDARYLSNAIQISEVGDGVLLLNPAVLGSDGEWEAWFFANWLPGANRYRSFLELLRAIDRNNGNYT